MKREGGGEGCRSRERKEVKEVRREKYEKGGRKKRMEDEDGKGRKGESVNVGDSSEAITPFAEGRSHKPRRQPPL